MMINSILRHILSSARGRKDLILKQMAKNRNGLARRAFLQWGLLGLVFIQNVRAEEISWAVPVDGGTPRDLARIERTGPREFHIRASFEEGGESVLRHAISRMDLICRNDGKEATNVSVHLDLSGDGKRTDYDTKPESGMKLRDFIFIQSPGKGWQQVDGTTDRWVATVTFRAEPGETKVGLSPWYTYADLLKWLDRLPLHPHLEKKLVAKSEAGREHWELTITDPTIDLGKKEKIFWQAREHAYETWSSFAMEGLVDFLLSESATLFRRRYIIVLHPMTNVDGVAQGFEYRGGYDLPTPRGTATGRLTFETIDRLRPDYAVAWHNWVAPRDRNVVFYTDSDGGKATPRAWLRFTQLFPSLQSAGHRWKDESTPLKYNWEGRNPLSEGNPHQYAMKKYRTRVWGWEMPWWNFTVEDSRRMGASFGRAFLTTVDEIRTSKIPAITELPAFEVRRWSFHEFTAKGRAYVENPFRDAAWVGEFVSPSGKTNIVDGFHDGNESWRLRFTPTEAGAWSYLLRGEGVEILQRGKIVCTPGESHGFISIHPENPYAFAYADGTPFFPMGDTCYGLHDDSTITPDLREEYLKTRHAQHFNFVRMGVGHSEPRAATNSAYWAWGGTPRQPDLDRINPVFFQSLDELFEDLRTSGMNIELILLNFYRRPFTDTNVWTQTRERLWLRYLVSRYAAFDNIFLWTIANEYETHPDGKYRLDFPADVEWARSTGRFIKGLDPYRHLVTVHPVVSASTRGESPRAPIEQPWRIGEFFGTNDAMDVLSQQTGQSGEGIVWDEKLQCWTGDSTGVSASVSADRKFKKPVLNTENGYEYLRGHPTERTQVHHTDRVRRNAWRIVCAGGHFATGFNGTIGHSDIWNRIDAPNHYTFTIRDEGAANQLSALHELCSSVPFWRMHPFPDVTDGALAIAEVGKNYVVYLPRGGSTTVDLANGNFTARWFDPRIGKFNEEFRLKASGNRKFTAPDTNDWVLAVTSVP
jgi:hypothetical protein